MRLKIAIGPGKAVSKSFATADNLAMIAWVKDFATQPSTVQRGLCWPMKPAARDWGCTMC